MASSVMATPCGLSNVARPSTPEYRPEALPRIALANRRPAPSPNPAPLRARSLSATARAPWGLSMTDSFDADVGRIREVARCLDYDWRKCYAFVRDYISYVPYPGILRGPERTLIDRAGNDADQSLLLLALLKASGYDAGIWYAPCPDSDDAVPAFSVPLYSHGGLYSYNAASWLGVREVGSIGMVYSHVVERLSSAGLRTFLFLDTARDDALFMAVDHFWVWVDVDEGRIDLDPSFKPTEVSSPHDVIADSGFTFSALLTAANASTADGIAVASGTAPMDAYLDGCCATLRRHWSDPNAAPSEFIGSQRIVPWRDESFFHGDCSAYPVELLERDDDYINGFRALVTIVHGGLTTSFYLDELADRNLWISYVRSAYYPYPRAILHLDSVAINQERGWSDSEAETLQVSVRAPDRAPFGSTSAGYSIKRTDGNIYAINAGFGGGNGLVDIASERLTRQRSVETVQSPLMRAEALAVVGQRLFSELSDMNRFANGLDIGWGCDWYAIGVAGDVGARYVDVKNRFGSSDCSSARIFDGRTFFASALEHSSLEQLDASTESAVSTARLAGMAFCEDGVFHAAGDNWTDLSSRIVQYPESAVEALGALTSSGAEIFAPVRNGATVGDWTGTWHAAKSESDSVVTYEMSIGGDYSGGYATEQSPLDVDEWIFQSRLAAMDDGSASASFQADPVVMPSGAFVDSSDDLKLGGKSDFVWRRMYDSRCRFVKGDMGRGWSHGFEAAANMCTDVASAFGGGSVDAAIPTALAVSVVDRLMAASAALTHGEKALRMALAVSVADWWTRRISLATLSVRMGARSLRFFRRPDGSFASPPGVTAEVSETDGRVTLTERFGNSFQFDSVGRLSRVVDHDGNVTSFSSPGGRLLSVTDAFGRSFSLTWSGNGRIVGVTDSAGRTVRYGYDAVGMLVAVTNAAGKVSRYAYDTSGLLLRKVDPEGMVSIRNLWNEFGQVTNQMSATGGKTSFGAISDAFAWNDNPLDSRFLETFDDKGRVLVRCDRNGAETSFVYDGHGHALLAADALGSGRHALYGPDDELRAAGFGDDQLKRITYYGHDASHRVIAETNAVGGVAEYRYDAHDRVVGMTNPDGSVVENTWNQKGLLASTRIRSFGGDVVREVAYTYSNAGLPLSETVRGAGLPAAGIVTSYRYDAAGNLTRCTDANGHSVSTACDRRGLVTNVVDALGGRWRRSYTASGRLASETDPLGRDTRYTWTASGRLASTTYPDGAVETNVYDLADNLVRRRDVRGEWTGFAHDAEGRVISSWNSAGTNSVVYDAVGNVIAVTNAIGDVVRTEYDALYRPVVETDGTGARWYTKYNRLDWPTATTNPLGKVRRWLYDPLGRPTACRRPSGAIEANAYDVFGNIIAFTNSEGHVYTQSFDALGRLVSATNALGECQFLARYDGAGNCLSRTDGNGNEVSFTYDAGDRLTSRSTDDGLDRFAYDAVGNLVTASNAVASFSCEYDLRDRLESAEIELAGHDFDVAWQRDAGGLVTNLVCGSDMSVAKTYDLRGRLTSLRVDGHEWTFAYDAENRLVGDASPDGVSRSFSYDAAGRISSWSVGSLAGRTITRDAAGRRIRDTVTAGPMPRSSFARSARNVFDAADRLVSASVVIGGRNVPITETYLYDGNGALTNLFANGESVFNASYDASGRLASLGTNGWHCAYDALGNRIRMGDRIFLPDYDDPLKRPLIECAADGSVIRRYLWGPTGLLGFIDADGALTVAHSDEQGSVIALTDIDGNVLFRANYGPYGEDWGSSGFNPTPFFWLGGLGVMKVDPFPHSPFPIPHSLYLTRHRLYSPVLRRFLSADPLGFTGGANLYAYADGNPLAYVDPLGLCAEDGEFGFLESLALGAAMGDFADDTGVGGTVGQIGVGLIPIAGQIADARDTAANFVNVWNNPSSGDAWIGLAMSGVAWVPGAGDAVKSVYKGGKQVAKKSVKAAGSVMAPVRTLQTGGHTLNSSTLRELGLSKEQGKRAIEALKKNVLTPNDSHGKILSNGDLISREGEYLGNIYQYVP